MPATLAAALCPQYQTIGSHACLPLKGLLNTLVVLRTLMNTLFSTAQTVFLVNLTPSYCACPHIVLLCSRAMAGTLTEALLTSKPDENGTTFLDVSTR